MPPCPYLEFETSVLFCYFNDHGIIDYCSVHILNVTFVIKVSLNGILLFSYSSRKYLFIQMMALMVIWKSRNKKRLINYFKAVGEIFVIVLFCCFVNMSHFENIIEEEIKNVLFVRDNTFIPLLCMGYHIYPTR